jgi:protein gp37
MTDVFGIWVPQEWINRFLDGMAAAPKQTFQVLTKRADRMRHTVKVWLEARGLTRVPSNIQLGVSVENQKWADIRIPELIKIPSIRFLSCEPLIDGVNLDEWLSHSAQRAMIHEKRTGHECGAAAFTFVCLECDHTSFSEDPPPIDWIICGGESGPNARPMHPDWARSLRDQCRDGGVPFFFKQWGEHVPVCDMPEDLLYGAQSPIWVGGKKEAVYKKGKARTGRNLDGREWNEFPKSTLVNKDL